MGASLDRKYDYVSELRRVGRDLSGILRSNFVGFYVMGSFVMGDWDPRRSDIDFIAVTRKPLNKKESLEIGRMHRALSRSDLGKKLDGAYTYLEQLWQKRFEERTGSFEDHEFKADCPCHLSADNILSLIEYGKCIQGLPIEELGLRVSNEELSQAAHDMLLEDMEEIDKKEAFQTLYSILIDILRCIYTLKTRELPTKPRAIEYCKDLIGKYLYQNIKAFRDGEIDEFKIDKSNLKKLATYGMPKPNSNWERYYSTLKRMPRRLRKTAKFIADILPEMKSHRVEKVLDLGCGTGRHCVLLASSGFEVVGVDISKNALKMARKWVLQEKLKNVAFVRATMTNLPFDNCCLDAVISVSVIHHAFKKDIVTTLNEIFRILSKNGWFLANLASVTDPRCGMGKMLEDNTFWVAEAFEERHSGEVHHFFTKSELFRLLHNFVDKQVTKMKDKPNYWKVLAVK
jgi:ubiquinone/menaquinone biosynthesis C-methylase UbiE